MHWADKVAQEIIKSGKYKPYWVDDMKTPSGYAHIGSMMGPVVHSAIYRALKDLGKELNKLRTGGEYRPVLRIIK